MKQIQKNNIVMYTINGLYFRCETNQQARWMNESGYYILSELPKEYIL